MATIDELKSFTSEIPEEFLRMILDRSEIIHHEKFHRSGNDCMDALEGDPDSRYTRNNCLPLIMHLGSANGVPCAVATICESRIPSSINKMFYKERYFASKRQCETYKSTSDDQEFLNAINFPLGVSHPIIDFRKAELLVAGMSLLVVGNYKPYIALACAGNTTCVVPTVEFIFAYNEYMKKFENIMIANPLEGKPDIPFYRYIVLAVEEF